MIYNFDERIDRKNNNAAKFEEAYLHFGSNDVIPLWIADMDFKTAQPIIDAVRERAEQGIFGYTSRPEEYFKLIAKWQQRQNGYLPDVNKMAFAPGVIPAMRMILNLFTQENDKILIQYPVYHPFTDLVQNSSRRIVPSRLIFEHGRYTMDYDDFEEKAKNGVKYFLLCNPHNPVGRCWSREELKRVGDICVKYNIKVISDEIHSDLMLFGNKHTVFASISDEIASLTTTCIAPSKTFNLAGLQSSTIIFPNTVCKEAYETQLKAMDIARNNCFSLVATMAAYEHGEEWLTQLKRYLEGNMRFIGDYCRENIPFFKPNLPECTYLCWIDARDTGMTDDKLFDFTVRKAKVACSMGVQFGKGGEGFLRLNAACPRSTLEDALGRIKSAAADNPILCKK